MTWLKKVLDVLFAPFIFFYQWVNEAFGKAGTLIVAALFAEALWRAGGSFYDLIAEAWRAIVYMTTNPPGEWWVTAGSVGILLSFAIALYKTGLLLTRFNTWFEKLFDRERE